MKLGIAELGLNWRKLLSRSNSPPPIPPPPPSKVSDEGQLTWSKISSDSLLLIKVSTLKVNSPPLVGDNLLVGKLPPRDTLLRGASYFVTVQLYFFYLVFSWINHSNVVYLEITSPLRLLALRSCGHSVSAWGALWAPDVILTIVGEENVYILIVEQSKSKYRITSNNSRAIINFKPHLGPGEMLWFSRIANICGIWSFERVNNCREAIIWYQRFF